MTHARRTALAGGLTVLAATASLLVLSGPVSADPGSVGRDVPGMQRMMDTPAMERMMESSGMDRMMEQSPAVQQMHEGMMGGSS